MLDQPGEFACVNLDGGQAEFRYIPVNDADASNENPILSNLEVIWNINRATNINIKGSADTREELPRSTYSLV